jgi:hypothetical protein
MTSSSPNTTSTTPVTVAVEGSAPSMVSRKLSVREAAALLGLSASLLNKLRLYGGGPVFIAAGRRRLYDPADLEAWVASRKRRHTSEVD